MTVPGVYTVRQFVGEELMAQTSIEFAPGLATRPARGGVLAGPSATVDSAQRVQDQIELWPWVAVLALTLVLVEWWIFHRVRGVR